MKKLIFLIVVFLSVSAASFGQNTTGQPEIYAMLGNIPLFTEGKTSSPVVTREEILSNPTVIALPPAGAVLGYKFRMQTGTKDAKITGPIVVKGADFTPEIKNMLLNLKDARAKIFIDEIKVKVEDKEMSARPIILIMQPKQ